MTGPRRPPGSYYRDVAAGFDALAPGYDGAFPDNRALEVMRATALAAWLARVRPGSTWLELGAGTGRDAVAAARRGARVLATDPSAGMLARLRANVRAARAGGLVRALKLSTDDLPALAARWPARFDGVAALFGALNYEPAPERLPPALWRVLRPGGWVVAAVRNRFCPWEIAYNLLVHPSPRLAFRRLWPGGAVTSLGRRTVRMRVFTPGGLIRLCRPWFEPVELKGLAVALPPYMVARFPARAPRLARWLARLEPRVAAWPVARALGDHFLLVLRRRDRD